MRAFCDILSALTVLAISLASIYSAAILSPVSAPSLEPSNTRNSSTTLSVPDERFQVEASYWGPKLQSMRCIFNTINAITNMALGEFYGDMGETTFELDEEPGVAITIMPHNWQQFGRMERRFAVWGIYLAAFDMTKKSGYGCSTFHLLWDEKEVGTIAFSRGVIRPLGQLATSSASSKTQSQGLLSLSNTTAATIYRNSTRDLNAGSILSINVDLQNTIVPIGDIFLVVVGALSDLASVPNKDGRVKTYTYTQAPVPAWLSFTTLGFNPRRRPPYMTYRHIIETLAQLPHIMYADRKFAEADVVVALNGVDVGMGILRKVPLRLDLERGAANVSIS